MRTSKVVLLRLFLVVAWMTTITTLHAFTTSPVQSSSKSTSTALFSTTTTDRTEIAQKKKKTLNDFEDSLPAVEFTDPKTNCQVVLLGCFHGTESSARDVETVVTPDTNVVVLELCTSRFADMRREVEKEDRLSWLEAYAAMIGKTVDEKGVPTGMAAAVLAGFSGLQSAISGFSPGLEFSTAMTCAQALDSDIVLADQDVDETLQQVGSLPQISFGMARSRDRLSQWGKHQRTLQRALLGEQIENIDLPQVQLGLALTRNAAAIQDLVRLTVPPTLLFYSILQGLALVTHSDLLSGLQASNELMTPAETVSHWMVSAGILTAQYLAVALPSVRVILTERDEILTEGIQAACQRAGDGGRVVAVLGMLHVNGVAKRMLVGPDEDVSESAKTVP